MTQCATRKSNIFKDKNDTVCYPYELHFQRQVVRAGLMVVFYAQLFPSSAVQPQLDNFRELELFQQPVK